MSIYDMASAIQPVDIVGNYQQGQSFGNALTEMRRKREQEVKAEEVRNGLAQFYRLGRPEQVTDLGIGFQQGGASPMGDLSKLNIGFQEQAASPIRGAMPEQVSMRPTVTPATPSSFDYQGAADYLAGQGQFEQAGALGKLRGMMTPDGIDYGLNPQLGINPQTNSPEFFVTNKNGQPRFLGITEKPRLDVKGGWIMGPDGQPDRPLPTTPAEQSRLQAEQERLRLAREADARAAQAAARAEAEAAKPKAVTEGERNAAGFLSRMEAAEGLLDGKTPFKTAGDKLATSYAPGGDSLLKNQLMSNDGQLYQQAAMDWVRAKLRKESGAVIGADEAAQEYRTYFPMPGDSEDKIRQKAQARKEAMKALRIGAGGAYKPNSPESAGGIQVQAPNGKTYTFPTQQAADDFRKKAGLL